MERIKRNKDKTTAGLFVLLGAESTPTPESVLGCARIADIMPIDFRDTDLD